MLTPVVSFVLGATASFVVVRFLKKTTGLSLAASIDDKVQEYQTFLGEFQPFHLKRFRQRLAEDPQSTRSEAVCWDTLSSIEPRTEITPGETKKRGGPDFFCQPQLIGTPIQGTKYAVEVTSLSPEAVSERSGWPNTVEEGGRAFSMITKNLEQKLESKHLQHENSMIPLVVMVTSSHVASDALLGPLSAKILLNASTKLFQKWQIISAVLLLQIYKDRSYVLGMVNPEASNPLDIGYFPNIPFLRAVKWPPNDPNQTESEWTVAHPKATEFLFVQSFPTNTESN